MLGIDLVYTLNEKDQCESGLRNDLMTILAAIESERSINAAAKHIGMSYRHLWGKIELWEKRFGQVLVTRKQGRFSSLSPLGRKLLWAERSVQAKYAVNLAKIQAELNTAFSIASNPEARILSIGGCFDAFLANLSDPAYQQQLILDFHFNTSVEGLEQLHQNDVMVAGFNFPEEAPIGSESFAIFSKRIYPQEMVGCRLLRRRQGIVVAPGNPHQIASFADIFAKSLPYAARLPKTGTFALQQTLMVEAHVPFEVFSAHSKPYSSHLAVATAVASGEAAAGLCLGSAATEMGMDFIPVTWENYYLAWHRDNTSEVKRLLDVVNAEKARLYQATRDEAFATPSSIEEWRALLPWWPERAQ